MINLEKHNASKRPVSVKTHEKHKIVIKLEGKRILHRSAVSRSVLKTDVYKNNDVVSTSIFRKNILVKVYRYRRNDGAETVHITRSKGSFSVKKSSSHYGGVARQKHRGIPTGFGEVVGRATQLFGSKEAALEWIKEPSRWLDNRSPSDLIEAGKREDVDRYLEQVEYGVYV